jgi:hypothetical protein
MYHKASISPLSSTQISKMLNGHSVRVSHGNQHNIELSKEQFKKFSRAHLKGKGMTLTMDPYQIQNHQHLRGCGNVKKTSRTNVKRLITSATDRAIRALEGSGVGGNITAVAKDSGKDVIVASGDRAVRAIEGSGVNRLKKASRWEGFANRTIRDGIDTAGKAARVYYDSTNPMAQMGYGIGGNITAVAKDSGKDVIVASGDRAVRAINGSGVNHLKKAGRWEQFANATVRDSIDTAGKAARVYYDSTNPMAQMGFGLRKRKAPKRRSKTGGALYVAGTP